MDWMVNVIVPAIVLIFYIAIFGFLLFVLIRFLYRYWNQRLKFIVRYGIFRQPYDIIMVQECNEAIEKHWSNAKLKMHLLKQGYFAHDIFEVLYIFEKVKQELGIKEVVEKINFKRK